MRKRVVAITLAGILPLTLFVQWSDMVVGGTMAAGPYPPLAACLQWALLLGILRIADRFRVNRNRQRLPSSDEAAEFRKPNAEQSDSWGRGLLTRGEILVIFAIWAAANMVAGRGMVHPLLTSLVGPVYYARSGAPLKAINQHLPDWLAVRESGAAVHFFEGYGLPVPWSVWRRPLSTWAIFFVSFITANVCLCALFETYWVRHERLAFPLVSLPMEALHQGDRPGGTAFRRVFAFGLAAPLLLHGFGVAHAYLPAVPCVTFFNDVSYLAATTPWTVVRPLYLNLYPLLIGVTFLAPTDVTLSVWFFLLLNKAELVTAAVAGWSDGVTGGGAPSPPYLEEQSAGAYFALAGVLAWNARTHLAAIARSFYPGKKASPHSEVDPHRYRLLALGFVTGTIGVLVWCLWTGLPLWFSAGFFGFYLVVALVLSRLMAESGLSWLLAPILPDKLILSLAGTSSVSQQVLTRLVLHVQHLRDTRQMLAPAVFQGGRLRDEARMGMRSFYGLLLLAVLTTLAVGVLVALPTFYRYGALSLAPNSDGLMMTANVIPTTGVNQLSSRLISPLRPSPAAALAVCGGAVVTMALSALRARLLWWPLNPLGYALTGTLQVGYANKMVLSIVLGWLFKTLALRFGGAKGFRLLRGAALGLILGDLIMGGVLKLLDALLGPSGYAIF